MKNIFAAIIIASVSMSFAQSQTFQIHSHRGCRAVLPENTIPGMIHAVSLGCTHLELDVVITGDKKVLVSHDPCFKKEICLCPDGKAIEDEGNTYTMNYAEIKKYDCGSLQHPDFPQQHNMPAHKPLLSELIDSVESYCERNNIPAPVYNVEIKSKKSEVGISQPDYQEFVSLVLTVIREKKVESRTHIQSFDIDILKEAKKQQGKYTIGLLTIDPRRKQNFRELGFLPDVYSPHYKLIRKNSAKRLHKKGILLVPWTVNEAEDVHMLIKRGVDGIITDDPKILINILKKDYL